jgi:hypothetical protein
VETFEQLQSRLGAVLEVFRPGSSVDHVVVMLPSFSLGESLLSHYGDRIRSLEHRYVLAIFILDRIERCEVVFLSCEAVGSEVVEYYLGLLPESRRASVRDRFRMLTVPDGSARSVAAKLVDRPDLLDDLRDSFAGRPAIVEPWIVTDAEVQVALHLGAPINGAAPHLLSLGLKSEGRRLFREVGVPVPHGVEDVRDVDDVVAAIVDIRRERPSVTGVVIKLDDSASGDGNVVVDLRNPADLRDTLAALPRWYLDDLAKGGVVEELITGTRFASPSAQIDVLPDGSVQVISTHDQVLGGNAGQVYMGCRFPADPAYAAGVADHALTIGSELGRRGVAGRASVDFAAAMDATGVWKLFALEINLRKGGTTHPFAALRNLVPGTYDAASGTWQADDGTERFYWATDNLVDPAWVDLPVGGVISAVADAGLQFDSGRGTGVVLHMLSGLAIDGRIGLTAIGVDPGEASSLYHEATKAIAGWADSRAE